MGVSLQTVYRHEREDEQFREQYERAREDAADTFADEITDIADTDDDVNRAKVRIDARKWVASRMKPKRWGDRQKHEVSGEGGGPLVIKWGENGD
jgi:hypothetical protein